MICDETERDDCSRGMRGELGVLAVFMLALISQRGLAAETAIDTKSGAIKVDDRQRSRKAVGPGLSARRKNARYGAGGAASHRRP